MVTSLHNHSLFRRILTYLNNTGFRKYSIQLVNWLETEIYGEIGGRDKYILQSKEFNAEAYEHAPLKSLAKLGLFELYAVYGDTKEDSELIRVLEENCNSKYPEGFQDSIYIRFFGETKY